MWFRECVVPCQVLKEPLPSRDKGTLTLHSPAPFCIGPGTVKLPHSIEFGVHSLFRQPSQNSEWLCHHAVHSHVALMTVLLIIFPCTSHAHKFCIIHSFLPSPLHSFSFLCFFPSVSISFFLSHFFFYFAETNTGSLRNGESLLPMPVVVLIEITCAASNCGS